MTGPADLSTPSFPAGFLWGATTGSHQTEGNNLASDWWARANAPGSPVPEPSGDATDSYHRWRKDMDLLAGAGLTDYRFGIERSRRSRRPTGASPGPAWRTTAG